MPGCRLKYLTDFYIENAGASLPGRGLKKTDTGLEWTVNAGILNDRDLPPIHRPEGQRILDQAARAAREAAPWLKMRFILDQPLDAEYILTTLTRDKKALQAARKPENRVLDLDPAALEHNSLIEKTNPALVGPRLAALKSLQLRKNQAGMSLVRAVPQSSLLGWRLFLRDQVRYDVILTNAVIFPDELDAEGIEVGADGAVVAAILPASGRSSMEQNALLLAASAPDASVARSIQSLLLLHGSGDRRRAQLEGLAEYYAGGPCASAPDPAGSGLSAAAQKALLTAYENLKHACGKKD